MKILIIKLSALGDIVHALPALHVLKDSAPDLEIDWFSYQAFAPLLSEQKAISKLITLKDRKISSLLRITKILRSGKYDLAIDMQGLIKTASLAKMSGAPVLGFAQPREAAAALLYDHSVDLGVWNSNETHVIDKNILLANYALRNILDMNSKNGELESRDDAHNIDKQSGREYRSLSGSGFDGRGVSKAITGSDDQNISNLKLHRNNIKYGLITDESQSASHIQKPAPREICLLPATTWESKLWPSEYWVELAQRLHQKYKSNIHIVCSPTDAAIVQPLLAQLKEACIPINFHQDFKLMQLPSFFRSMDLIVGVDTGPLHIAAATVDAASTRILGIYGPTSPKRSGPYGFASVSAEDLFEHKPMNKRKLSEDTSMRTILPELVLARILDSKTAIL